MQQRFYIDPSDDALFYQLAQEGIQKELEKKENNPYQYTVEDVYQDYIDNANDYEKYYLIYGTGTPDSISSVGLNFLRNSFNTELINDNYDAYLYARDAGIGDFDIVEIERDDYGELKTIVCKVHSDRFAYMSDDYRMHDNVSEVVLNVQE